MENNNDSSSNELQALENIERLCREIQQAAQNGKSFKNNL